MITRVLEERVAFIFSVEALKLMVARFSELFAAVYQTTRRPVPEDRSLYVVLLVPVDAPVERGGRRDVRVV
jgi:hypothetical protein